MLSKRKICWKDDISNDTKSTSENRYSFNETQEGHHRGVSLFLQLHNLDIIHDFPLDYLHQVCLGVMKKLLLTWNRGPRAMFRISATQNEQVSNQYS